MPPIQQGGGASEISSFWLQSFGGDLQGSSSCAFGIKVNKYRVGRSLMWLIHMLKTAAIDFFFY